LIAVPAQQLRLALPEFYGPFVPLPVTQWLQFALHANELGARGVAVLL
jgi:hypothetical protein